MQIGLYFDPIELNDISWQSAHATGALVYISYDEVQKFGAIYAMQKELLDTQTALSNDVFLFFGTFAG